MRTYRLALIGFGNVGQGLAQIIRDQGDDIARQLGVQITIVAVSDLLKGSLYDPDGLSPTALLDAVQTSGDLNGVAAPHRDWNAQQTIAESSADVLVELSYTDLESGEPAVSHISQAIEKGLHIVTTNKGPIALRYPRLSALARDRGVEIGIEGTVMSGTPTMALGQDLLAAANITRIQGIVNGTTNYILSQMENGTTYNAALAEAQEKGYAEADPSGDVEGFDAAGKVVIMANVLMDASITLGDVARQGITGLTPQDIETARSEGRRWKLIASIEKTASGVKAGVRPTRLPTEHPLASVSGPTNAVTFTTDLLGDVTLIGPGAGRMATGYAIVCDLLGIARKVQPREK
ncbi:MAG: homoserine dehydrogenase [Anaerolineae bacterium]|nr:homoserine dehydrogenase [Anaerolineae bacterium]